MRNLEETGTILFCVLLGAAGQILLKVGTATPLLGRLLEDGRYPDFILRALLSPAVMGGLLLYAASTMFWLAILARSELSYAYPFISIGFVATTLFGWLALGEMISAGRIAGITLVIVGVVLVARS